MIDKSVLKDVVAAYKRDFAGWWPEEKFKWEAVKCFQDNWDVDAPDFAGMIGRSLDKTDNLLISVNNFPASMITQFAEASPERVRKLFKMLYNESIDLAERFENFKAEAEVLRREFTPEAKNHYQNENVISVYLWLKYPDKYYIYKIGVLKDVADTLNSNYVFKRGHYSENIRNYLGLYDEICSELQRDSELTALLKSSLTPDCYTDPQFRTLTVDIAFYISKVFCNSKPVIWKISHGTERTGISDEYKSIFADRHVVVVNGETKPKAIAGVSQGKLFTDRIKQGDYFYLCYGNEIKLLGQITSECAAENPELKNGWYEWGYQTIATAVNHEPYKGEKKWWTPNDNSTCIKVQNNKLFEKLILQPYFHMSIDDLEDCDFESTEVEKSDSKEKSQEPTVIKPYTKSDFLSEVYMSESEYNSLRGLLLHKKNIILQGAPGVGKTFAAERLAYSVMGEMDNSRIGRIQFHQNYSYEDFMMGYKPDGERFSLKTGIFYDFCKKAEEQPADKYHFFIIDEINRGNLSKIFGELLMLIEKDYRGTPTVLAYNGEPFSVPQNLYIIGMMNTADRSLAMIDYALRRRFSFFDMEPGFDSEGFKKYQAGLANEKLDKLVEQVERLDEYISNDKSLGKGFCIGHSYFCGQKQCSDEWLHAIVEYDILPTLREYWFDDEQKVSEWEGKLRGAING